MNCTKEWQKEIDFSRISIWKLYPNEILPEDINVFLRDVFSMGIKYGRHRAYIDMHSTLNRFKESFENLDEEIKANLESLSEAEE